jgi:hypothetical protein
MNSLDNLFSDKFANELETILEKRENSNNFRAQVIDFAHTIIRIICLNQLKDDQRQLLNPVLHFLYKKPLQDSPSLFEPIAELMIEYNFLEFVSDSLRHLVNSKNKNFTENNYQDTFVHLANILIYYGDESVRFRRTAVFKTSLVKVLAGVIASDQDLYSHDFSLKQCVNVAVIALYNLSRIDDDGDESLW